MKNELIFFLSIIISSIIIPISLKISKECLISLISLLWVLTNLFVIKEINLFGLIATASDSLSIAVSLSLNLLHEYEGRDIAKKAIYISLFCSLCYLIFSILHISYNPALRDVTSKSFNKILSPSFRIITASLYSYFISQLCDNYIYYYISNIIKLKNFIIKNYLSLIISQLIDTVVFSFLGLYKLNQAFNDINIIFQIILVSYIIKLITIALYIPFLFLSKKII